MKRYFIFLLMILTVLLMSCKKEESREPSGTSSYVYTSHAVPFSKGETPCRFEITYDNHYITAFDGNRVRFLAYRTDNAYWNSDPSMYAIDRNGEGEIVPFDTRIQGTDIYDPARLKEEQQIRYQRQYSDGSIVDGIVPVRSFGELYRFSTRTDGTYAMLYSYYRNTADIEMIYTQEQHMALSVFQPDGSVLYEFDFCDMEEIACNGDASVRYCEIVLMDDGTLCMYYGEQFYFFDADGTLLSVAAFPINAGYDSFCHMQLIQDGETQLLYFLYPDDANRLNYLVLDPAESAAAGSADAGSAGAGSAGAGSAGAGSAGAGSVGVGSVGAGSAGAGSAGAGQLVQPQLVQPQLVQPQLVQTLSFQDNEIFQKSIVFDLLGNLYFYDDFALYRYDDAGQHEQLFRWSSVDIVGANIDHIYFTDDRNFIVVTKSITTEFPELVFIDYVLEDSVPTKTEIVLACGEYDDGSLRALQTAVTLFNRSSTEYHVNVIYYTPSDDELLSMNRQIANDMMRGEQIDLILFHNDVTMEYFNHLGILGDWYPLVQNDADYPRDAFLPCILNAYQNQDGTLPTLTTDFGLTTLAAVTENVGGMKDWTYAECIEFSESLAWDQILLKLERDKGSTESDAMLVLKSFLPVVLDDYLDMENNTCDLDSDSFREFLTLCNTILIDHETAAYKKNDNFIESIYESEGYINEYRTGHTILFNEAENQNNGAFTIQTPSDIQNIKGNFFKGHENITFIGYPLKEGAEKSGTAVTPWIQFGLTANAEHADGAWEFIKGYLDYQIQEQGNPLSYRKPYLPCTYDALAAALDYYEDRYYLMESGPQLVSYPSSYSLEDNPMYCKADMEVRAILTELVETANRRYSGNTAVMNIILEDAADYFHGVNTLNDVTKRMQNRINTYLSERKE